MKKKLLTIVALALALMTTAQTIDTDKLASQDLNAPFGFGANITGGNNENIVTVTSLSALQSALTGTGNKTIYVDGTITFNGMLNVKSVQNKTIIGMPGATFQNLNEDIATSSSDQKSAIAKTGILQFSNCSNIIIRNITFISAGACDFNANDNLCLDGSSLIWVDHCDFQDGVDGNFDCVNGSDNICVSWCRFRYLKDARGMGYGGSSSDHRFTNLWGNSDSRTTDEGKLCTTFYSCWWDDGCKERMPRIRYAKVHVLNCLYSSSIANYCVGGGYKSNAYIENCAFTSSKAKSNPWKCYASGSYSDYNITIKGCSGANDKQSKSGDIAYFIPSENYTYSAYDASLVESVVTNSENGAGPTLKIKSGSSDDEDGTLGFINWDFDKGTEGQTATVGSSISSGIASTAVTIGSTLSYASTKKINNIIFTLFAASKQDTGANEDNAVLFTITTAAGYSFKPTKYSFNASRVGTGHGLVDVAWINTNGSVILEQACAPAKNSEGGYTTFSKDVTTVASAAGESSLKLYLYDIPSSKQLGIRDINITGLLKNASGISEQIFIGETTEYYSLDGKRLAAPVKGINIQVTKNNNGTRQVKKIIF